MSGDNRPWLVLKTASGKTYLGKFTISEHKVARVLVDVQQRAPAAKSATAAKPTSTSAAPATP
jgi:superfamily II DNA or RNA helicase